MVSLSLTKHRQIDIHQKHWKHLVKMHPCMSDLCWCRTCLRSAAVKKYWFRRLGQRNEKKNEQNEIQVSFVLSRSTESLYLKLNEINSSLLLLLFDKAFVHLSLVTTTIHLSIQTNKSFLLIPFSCMLFESLHVITNRAEKTWHTSFLVGWTSPRWLTIGEIVNAARSFCDNMNRMATSFFRTFAVVIDIGE